MKEKIVLNINKNQILPSSSCLSLVMPSFTLSSVSRSSFTASALVSASIGASCIWKSVISEKFTQKIGKSKTSEDLPCARSLRRWGDLCCLSVAVASGVSRPIPRLFVVLLLLRGLCHLQRATDSLSLSFSSTDSKVQSHGEVQVCSRMVACACLCARKHLNVSLFFFACDR